MPSTQLEHCFQENFNYSHKNPYHQKLKDFEQFVLTDKEGEKFRGAWNQHFFKREQPVILEIGSGYGHFMLEYCQRYPEHHYVGLDYRFKRSYQLARKLSDFENKNFCFLRAKGERLQFLFAPEELDQIFFFFPDPWPKTRHHKKRLFQAAFLAQCEKALKKGGQLLVKTDHSGYFQWMLEHFAIYQKQSNQLKIIFQSSDLHSDSQACPHTVLKEIPTKFEKLFLSQGKKIKALVIEKL